MEIQFSSHFIKRAKRLSSKEKRQLSERVEWFRKDPQDSRLKVHALTGRLKGLLSFSLTYGKRVVFVFVKQNVALFVDVGSHDDVYR